MIWGELMIPRRMGHLIDYTIPKKDLNILGRQILFLCGIVVVILIAKAIYQLMEQIIANHIIKDQQTDLMTKLQSLGYAYYEKVPTGQILSIFENAVGQTQQTYTFLFPQFIYAMAQFMVPSVVLIMEQPVFFLITMVGNIIYIFLNKVANQRIEYYLTIESSAAQTSQQSLYDAIEATTELKMAGSKDWIIHRTIQDFKKYKTARMWSIFWRHFRYTTVGLTLTISTVLFYFYGLQEVRQGTLLIGELIGYSFLIGLISRGFSVFFYIIPAQYNAINYARYLYDFLALEPAVKRNEITEQEPLTSFDIQLENVGFYYQKEHPIIENVSCNIPFVQKLAIVGESGCGKSTILKLIGRFYDVTSGDIKIGGVSVKELGFNQYRSFFGYVFQDTYLFHMSIKNNIRFGKPDATDEEIIEAAKMAKAHEFIMETEDGYDTILGERGVSLSGGQKQRLSIARMMLNDPKVILLDEATSALDNATELAVKEALEKFTIGKTVITVAHRLSTIRDYDSILVLDAGYVKEQGSYEELMSSKGLFYNLVMRGMQDEK
ncbi:thiamine ABC transporter permease [Anaeromicropila herbilytica]|uniref:Thiamine ABC transporter permease n=2 Tax=Anaeromicropila herbilytica TaxID=2785025 RepID=A0A7R7EI95_9FIRM|nr:thiamine ABC transporter permease [Anaeromicropila herbilytica]